MADINCTNSFTVVPPCPPACSEVFQAECIVYTGRDLTCGQDVVVRRYDYLDTIITKLVDYFCTNGGQGSQGPPGPQGPPGIQGPQGIPGTGADVTLTSAGGPVSLVNDGFGPALAIKGLSVGGGISLSDAGTFVTIINDSPATSVTLGSVGAGQSIVNDGNGPALVTKSIVGGNGISVTSSLTTVTISATPLYVEISGSVRGLQANVAGGRAPYTYTWYMADWTFSPGVSMWQLGIDPIDPTNPAKVLPSANPATSNVFDACASSNAGRAGMAKVVVTDSEGTKVSDTYFLYSVGCA